MFSCFARELHGKGGIAARSIPELVASFKHSYKGVRVEHVDQVVDNWGRVKGRFMEFKGLTNVRAFEIAKNEHGTVVLRYKATMSGGAWLPRGATENDRSNPIAQAV